MTPELVYITGGVRSGKSRFARDEATRLADSTATVTFIATALDAQDDPDMAARIERHRAERPASWRTIESSQNLAQAVEEAAANGGVVILDDLTNWVSRLLAGAGDLETPDARKRAEAAVRPPLERLTAALRETEATVIVVTNEVGSGVAPPTRLGNLYADLLGEVNAAVAAISDRAYLLTSGFSTRLR